MFKKLLITTAILAATTTTAFANGAPYVGISTGVTVNTGDYTNYTGMPGTIFAGFGANMGQGFYLAGEVFATLGHATITDNGLKSSYEYGVSVIPGVMISDHTMGFGRLGLAQTRFSPSGANPSTNTGVQFGLGLQTSLTQNWDLRGEYDYTAQKNLKGVGTSPKTNDTTIALIYKFD
jgi:opacity protein-like surface antigen